MKRSLATVGVLPLIGLLSGCTQYTVPGRSADFRALGITAEEQADRTGSTIATELAKRPAASFPATIALVRVQDRGYRSHTSRGYDVGRYSIVGVRDVETEEDLETLRGLPMVRGVVPLNRLVFDKIEDEKSIREAAARVQADMALVYTFDTKFGVETTIPALGVITLGLFPNDEARVTSTASAALLDTRSGYIYALAESTADTSQLANAWTNKDAVDQSRRRAEREAFEGVLAEMVTAWKGVAETYTLGPLETEGG